MKPTKLHLSDLLLLRDFFAPEKELYLLDTLHRIPENRSGSAFSYPHSSIDRESVSCVVETNKAGFNLYLSTESEGDWVRFDYINNPDGSIRWFYPSGSSTAGHLNLYNASGFKAGLYKALSRMVWKAGYPGLMASGSFNVQQILVESVKEQYGIENDELLSFFTGTRGITRKLVIEVHRQQQQQSVGFIKVPLTPVAKGLIENEINMVNSLSKYDFTTLSIPKISGKINGHARLSNIKPSVIIPADKITAIHIRALAELYALSHEKKTVSATASWHSYLVNMEFLSKEIIFINDIDRESVRKLIALLKQLQGVIPVNATVPVSVSHGDFTPWNMYCDEQRLYVYDWEMARNGIPMFFDLFHFTYQQLILQQQKGYSEVKSTIHQWTQQPLVHQLVKKYNIHLVLHHALYLLFNVSHYLRQYIGEKEPLIQSQWMMKAWTAAIEDYLVSAVSLAGKR